MRYKGVIPGFVASLPAGTCCTTPPDCIKQTAMLIEIHMLVKPYF